MAKGATAILCAAPKINIVPLPWEGSFNSFFILVFQTNMFKVSETRPLL